LQLLGQSNSQKYIACPEVCLLYFRACQAARILSGLPLAFPGVNLLGMKSIFKLLVMDSPWLLIGGFAMQK
jgi:hypothetical protein